jgi:hypothetical protein
MAGKIRPLLFWFGKDNVGGARIRWRQGEGSDRGYDLLIGSDPQRAPRKVNRWGFIQEESRGGESTVLGVIQKSEQDTLQAAQADATADGQQAFFWKMIQGRTVGDQSVASVTLTKVGKDYSYRDLDTLLDALVRFPGPPRTRRVAVPAGGQLTRPVNLEGAWAANTFVTTSRAVKALKSVLNLSGGASFNRTPGLVNGVAGHTRTLGLSAGLALTSNVSPWVDFTVSYAGTYNVAHSTISPSLDSHSYGHTIGAKLDLTSRSGFLVHQEIRQALTNGVAGGFGQNAVLWSSAIGRKFLRGQRGEVRLSGTDLLGQERSVARTVTETYLQDARNQVLGRYLLFTFTYSLR